MLFIITYQSSSSSYGNPVFLSRRARGADGNVSAYLRRASDFTLLDEQV